MANRLITFAVVLATIAFTGGTSMARDFSQIIASGQLRVAIAAEEFLPWMGHAEKGELLGFEVDVATKIAEDLGLKVEFVPRPFGDMITALRAKEVDIIISALSITPERAKQVMFSNPYGQSDVEMVVARPLLPENAKDNSYDMQGMKIAVIQQTTSEIEGRRRFQQSEIFPFPDRNAARDAFLAGDVNAIIATKPYPSFIQLYDNENYTVVGAPITSTVEAAAVHPDNHRLLNFVNSWIYHAIASGFLEGATHYWFETLNWVDRVPGMRDQLNEAIKKKTE